VVRKFPHSNFSANHIGKNLLSYGSRECRQPLLYFDTPLRKRNLTYKFGTGKYIQVVGIAGTTTTGEIRARALVFLLDESECRAMYGVGTKEFPTLSGGHDQNKPELIFAEYYDNSATAGTGKWENIAEVDIEDYEVVNLTHMGIKPHANAAYLRLYDDRYKIEFPEREPYWRVGESEIQLPFGDDEDYQPIRELPDFIRRHNWTETTLKVQIQDANAVIPAEGVRVQLLGKYKTMR